MNKIAADILVAGAGPAGLSAALAASERSTVTLVDDNPNPGGQIWRAEKGKITSKEAARLVTAIKERRINVINGATVFASPAKNTLLASTLSGTTEFEYQKLIIATGARERFLPFPGWTLPNVFGAGGLQALVKGGFDAAGRKVVIAGTGPLLLAVGDYLKAKGAQVILIAEQAPAAKINRFAAGLWSSPAKLLQAANLRRRLLGIKYLTDCWITSVGGRERVEYVELTRNGKTWKVDCDFIACGFHLVPNNELATLLGCRIENRFVVVDDLQTTSVDNIYCAGEPTGIGGVEAALIEGKIAGLAASGQAEATSAHLSSRKKAHKFADALNRTFALRGELKTLAAPDTIVCRCEDVAYGRLTEFDNSREAKFQTRCVMGPCQVRICAAATEFLFGWDQGSVRAPIFPVKIEEL